MNVTQKQLQFTIAGFVLLVAIGFFTYFYTQNVSVPSRSVLEGKGDLEAAYDKALKMNDEIAKSPNEFAYYLAQGNAWKLIGDSTHDDVWYKLALQTYKKGMEISNNKNTIFLMNAGHVEESLGNYSKAKKYYLMAIDLSPGDVGYYLEYIKLLRSKFNATPDEILTEYAKAAERVVGGADLISSRSQYLKSIGRYAEATADLDLLLKNNIITKAQYDGEIEEMQRLKEAQ